MIVVPAVTVLLLESANHCQGGDRHIYADGASGVEKKFTTLQSTRDSRHRYGTTLQ